MNGIGRFLLVVSLVACGSIGGADPADVTPEVQPPPVDVGPETDGALPDTAVPPPETTTPPDTTLPPSEVTYHSHVRSILAEHCLGCHETAGAAPFSLASYGETAPLATLMVASVTTGSMPPWTPDPTCRPMTDERILTTEAIDTIVAWEAAGAPEGDPASYIPPPNGNPIVADPDLLLDAGVGYTKNLSLPDDYRCFPLQHTFTEETYIVGSNVFPDQKSIVHHVLFYAVGPDDVSTLLANDAADSGPGYQCFGGPSVGATPLIGGWVPGMQPIFFPEGAAILMEAGSQIVMQIHYNALGVTDPGSIPEDRSKVGLWTLPAGEKPSHLVQIYPLANAGIQIPAGDPNSIHTQDFPFPTAATLIGVVPHMHLLGTKIGVTYQSAWGQEDACVVDIPEWDFNWQQFYWFGASNYLNLSPGDALTLTCVYDNSASNQPVVNGEQLPPKNVAWGEGTLDEMCLNYIVTMSPAPGDTVCGDLPACGLACPEGDGLCFLSCLAQAGNACVQCVGSPLADCISTFCQAQMLVLGQCLQACDGAMLPCLATDCASDYQAAYACIEPHLESGACDDSLAKCEVAYGN